MLSSLLPSLFPPRPPTCPGTGSALIRQRRLANDEKYTARPLDFFPNKLVSDELLAETRREADVLDGLFERYKREAGCLGSALGRTERGRVGRKGRLGKCEGCAGWCCDACRFHTSYRIVSSNPLLFSDDVFVPPGCTDHGLLAPNKRMQTLQIRLRDHEHPYDLALCQQYAQRWHGYCHACLPRVSATLIKQLDGQFQVCRCERADAARRWRGKWVCVPCFEEGCGEVAGGWEGKVCRGRACGRTLGEVGWEEWQAVCGWCLRILDQRGVEVAREALREGEGFEVLRKDSRR